MQRVFLPGSDYYLRFNYLGNKTEKRSSNPCGVLSRRLDRPDMLLISGCATVLVGADKVSMNVWQLRSISALVTVLMPHSGLSDVDMEVYECRQRATCTKLSKILKTTSRVALQHCSMAVSIICLALLLLVSLSSLASSIPLARCGHLMFPCYCPNAATLIKVLFQYHNVYTNGVDFSVCSCSWCQVSPCLLHHLLYGCN